MSNFFLFSGDPHWPPDVKPLISWPNIKVYLLGLRQKQEMDLTKTKTYDLQIFPKRYGRRLTAETFLRKRHGNAQRQQ